MKETKTGREAFDIFKTLNQRERLIFDRLRNRLMNEELRERQKQREKIAEDMRLIGASEKWIKKNILKLT